jgi:sialate O-acetylesterase
LKLGLIHEHRLSEIFMMMKLRLVFLILTGWLFASAAGFASVRLPRLISDGMVLQRDARVAIWGWASPSEAVSVMFNGKVYQTIAGGQGDWKVMLPGTAAGGPYTITVKGVADAVTVKDVLFGDVWLCAGQSNMELPVRRVSPIYEKEIATSVNMRIRCFTVPQTYDFKQSRKDFTGGSWQAADPQTVLNFSAVAYFFARELNGRYNVPVGIINSSLGGSPIESWMSEEVLKKYPSLFQEMQRWKNDSLVKSTESTEQSKIKAWYDRLRLADEGFAKGRQSWLDPSLDISAWPLMPVPGYWKNTPLDGVSGVVWFEQDKELPAVMAGKTAQLILGRIVDADSVFVNGIYAGSVSYQYPPRRYNIPAGILKQGKNRIVVRVICNSGAGGFVPGKQYSLSAGGQSVDLKGDWHYRQGARMEPTPQQTFIRWKPGGLFNAMLAPLSAYTIKGAVWYQGESNVGRAGEYAQLLPDMIADWRHHWNQGDFPFLFAQLPNFMEPKDQPSESSWALLRESQLRALAVPNTAMTVNIDLGEWNDIHPLNKKDVAHRLALAAEKLAYKTNVVASGPVFSSMKIERNEATLTFTGCGSGLTAGGGTLKGFAIAGADGKFYWADARVVGNKVVIGSAKVEHPVAVRYAWADNPAGANLYNREGLPASPFRTGE